MSRQTRETTVVSHPLRREPPYFTDAERAALALAEAVTRIADRPDPVPDGIWDEAARHYDELTLGALLISIGTIDVWNRLNAATRQIAGKWVPDPGGCGHAVAHTVSNGRIPSASGSERRQRLLQIDRGPVRRDSLA
jgi:hypothetical protein